MYASPAYRGYDGEAIFQNGRDLPATPVPHEYMRDPQTHARAPLSDNGTRVWSGTQMQSPPPYEQELSQLHAQRREIEQHLLAIDRRAQEMQGVRAQYLHPRQQQLDTSQHHVSPYVAPNHMPYAHPPPIQPPMQQLPTQSHMQQQHQQPYMHAHQGEQQRQHVSTQQTPMFAHQQQQAATFAERVQSWFGSPHPQQQTAPQMRHAQYAGPHSMMQMTRPISLPKVKPLTSDEIKALKFPLVPHRIINTIPIFWGIAMQRNAEFEGAIEMLINLKIDTIGAASSANPYIKAANLWIASNIFVCLDNTCEEVGAFKRKVAMRTGMLYDGILLLHEINEYTTPRRDATEPSMHAVLG